MNPETHPDLQPIFNFISYGRLEAPLWFLGLEEGLGKRYKADHWSPAWELETRAAWPPVIDMRQAHETLLDPYWDSGKYSQVWLVMAQLARGILQRAADWHDPDKARVYVTESLGRAGGETLLGEMLPLPERYRRHWSYPFLFPSKEDYEWAILPQRRALWRRLVEEHRPRVVICYGGLWYRYKDVFAKDGWQAFPGTDVQTVVFAGKTQVFLTPFLGREDFREKLERVITHFQQ